MTPVIEVYEFYEFGIMPGLQVNIYTLDVIMHQWSIVKTKNLDAVVDVGRW